MRFLMYINTAVQATGKNLSMYIPSLVGLKTFRSFPIRKLFTTVLEDIGLSVVCKIDLIIFLPASMIVRFYH